MGDKLSLSFPHSTPQSHRPTAPSKPRVPSCPVPCLWPTSPVHNIRDGSPGSPLGGGQGFCCPHWPLYATSCPGPAPSSWPPGSPGPRLGPAGFPRPHTAHQGGQRPWSPVKSKHTHTHQPNLSFLPLHAAGRQREQQRGRGCGWEAPAPGQACYPQCCPLAQSAAPTPVVHSEEAGCGEGST